MKIELRPALLTDAKLLHFIQRMAFYSMYQKYGDDNSPYNNSVERMEYYISVHAGRIYKIAADDVIVGAVWYFVKSNDIYYLARIFVHPDMQGRGIAYEAIRMMEQKCPDAREWELNTPCDALGNRHLYEKLGYKSTEEIEIISDKLSLVTYRKGQTG